MRRSQKQGGLGLALGSLAMVVAAISTGRAAEDPVFSGPQAGEKLTPFKVLGAYDDAAGKELDFVAQADGKPLLLVFVHSPLTRPSASVTRGLSAYGAAHPKELRTGIVWLDADRSKAEQYLKTARPSLGLKSPLGISLDGVEGPGSYGLNRNVSLTVLVANENKVTANFALVQPSTTDGPKILAKVVELIGGTAPTQEEFDTLTGGRAGPARPAANKGGERHPRFRELLQPVINLKASEEDVRRAAAAVEAFVAEDNALQQQLADIARTIIDSGNLTKYGTPPAQEQLKVWAKKYGPPEPEKKERKE